jgi:hypothetical protein
MNVYTFNTITAVGFRSTYNLTDSDSRLFFDSFVRKETFWGRNSVKSIWQPLTMKWYDPYAPCKCDDDDDEEQDTDNDDDYQDDDKCDYSMQYTEIPATIIADFVSCTSFYVPTYSERAVQILSPYLGESVEFLPLKCDDGVFYASKVLSIMDNALNLEKSKIEWDLQTQKDKENNVPPRIQSIKEYSFNEDVIKDLFIFIQKQKMLDIYVTQRFVDIVNEHGLTGGKFVQVYPPEDPNEIRRRAYEKAMKRRKKKNN